jgi:hypothetical protein
LPDASRMRPTGEFPVSRSQLPDTANHAGGVAAGSPGLARMRLPGVLAGWRARTPKAVRRSPLPSATPPGLVILSAVSRATPGYPLQRLRRSKRASGRVQIPVPCPEGATGESPGWNPGDDATQRPPCPERAHGRGCVWSPFAPLGRGVVGWGDPGFRSAPPRAFAVRRVAARAATDACRGEWGAS